MTLGDGIGRNKGCKSYVFQKGYKTAIDDMVKNLMIMKLIINKVIIVRDMERK